MIRKSVHSIEEVFNKVIFTENPQKRGKSYFDGDEIKMGSYRLQLFKLKKPVCVCCGLEGKFFAKEKSLGSKLDIYHLNLYAINNEGKEVLMTKDHIIPKSKGGKNHITNFQVMCSPCNTSKGNKVI